MANLTQVLQDEIRRLARKELKGAVSDIQSENTALRREVVQLRKRLESVEKGAARPVGRPASAGPGRPRLREAGESSTPADRLRISSNTVIKLREKLGLTQAELGKLLGVSGQSVYQWERRNGRLRLRKATREAFLHIRDIGAREARSRLLAMGD